MYALLWVSPVSSCRWVAEIIHEIPNLTAWRWVPSVVSASCAVGSTRKDLTDPVDVSLPPLVCCRFTLRKAIAVHRSRLRCSGVATATPKRLFGAGLRTSGGPFTKVQSTNERARSNAPLPPYSSCSLHMLVILPTGTNRMNSCRSTANHEVRLIRAVLQAVCRTISRDPAARRTAHSTQLASRSSFKVRIACIAAKRPVRSLNLDNELACSTSQD